MAKLVMLSAEDLERRSAARESSPPPAGAPPLSYEDIVAWTGQTSIQRGTPYVGEALFDTRRTGYTLKARCQGTAAQPYRVTATLGAQGGVAQSTCSCPVGGRCKHVAALLLSWLRDPDAFLEIEDLETALERRDKPELIALIRQMIARHPELETLIELPLPVAGKPNKPADITRIRREVAVAFHGAGDDWYAATEVAQSLDPLVDLGDDYARLGDPRSAAAIYQAVAQGVTDHYDEVQDDEGDLNAVVDRCVEGIDACLETIDDAAQREGLLRALFDLYRWDVSSGGIGMAETAPHSILERSSPAERQMVAGWVRAALPTGDYGSADWRRKAFGGFLLGLEGDEIDDEAFLQICRDTGRRGDLVERLVVLGRLDEAEAEIRQAGDVEMLRLADLLRNHGHTGRAERLVRERRAAVQNSGHLTKWLRDRARERGDLDEALTLTEALFWQHPGLPGYDELKEAAQAVGNWDTLRPELLRRLAGGRHQALLAEIHLKEGEIEQALALVKQGPIMPIYAGDPLPIRVARAAEDRYPADAIALYRAAASRLIQAQGRDNYITAASYLGRARDLYRRQGADATWNALISEIRTENRRLRALKEELDRAGL